MASVNLDWASAEVDDATLTVPLEGEPAKDWKQSFERTIKLLGGGEWDEIRLKKGAVQVSGVTPGTEDKLRHHLESILAQANAAHERHEQAGRDEVGQTDRARRTGEPDGPDAEMTAHFRAFAEPSEGDA